MENLNLSLGQVLIVVPAKTSVFTFVPVVQKLPVKSIITAEERSGVLTGKPNKETMTDGEIFTGDIVFLKDSMEAKTGNIIHPETKFTWKPSLCRVSLSQCKASPSLASQSENTPNHVAALTGSMETAVDIHRGTSQQQRRDTLGRAEVSSGCFANRASVSEDTASPALCTDLFLTPASSRESVLSEGSDRGKSWLAVQPSSVTSPASFSRTVSPCSSVLSGIFSPAVIQIKKHFLAPGSSLVNIPQTCFSSCESLSSSVSLGSPRPRHRPPLTRLSLLTAILRKGRLPVLSSVLQRPYTPCWPVNPVTLSFCNACSAASSVASIPLEFSSSAPVDIQREPNRCVTAPPPLRSNEFSRTCPQTQVKRCSKETSSRNVPRWEVISPPPAKSNTPRAAALPLLRPNFECVPLPKHKNISDCASSKTLQNTHISTFESPELKSINSHIYFKGHRDNNLAKLLAPSPTPPIEQETFAAQHSSRPPSSSLSRLRLLSQQLRSPPVCSPQPQASQSRSPGVPVFSSCSDTASPLLPLQNNTGRCESERRWPGARSVTPSHAFPSAYCLSPSRYTPIVFSGWPSPTSSPTPTPSPAPPVRDLTPSPSLSTRTTPSPRPGSGISNCSDREGKKRKTHRIKSSYKSLAAIPTNTLLLDQQAIDEQVERQASPCDTLDRGVTLDTHAEMCSPAQLRQQSEELYAAIDEVLANSEPPQPRKSPTGAQQNNSSLPKSLGRETKYASVCSLHPSADVERKKDPYMTKPGVIRPMTAIPRLRVEDKKEFYTKPLRPSVAKKTLSVNKKVENTSPEGAHKDFYISSNGQTLREERKLEKRSPFSVCDLQITEHDDHISHHVNDTSVSFSPTEDQMEIHI
ncbi:hypothetical protein Q5P01_021385 [Channa striata]|uniref:Muscular LMNA-interacting protein n=1 Tax=Channa striata TaxID=64152 RepID=A0AA88RY82_CHASR|nr:hypothetical protein Q5P01_021385 [Channa striata]